MAEFLKAYFSSDMPEIYTKRGKLLDDKCDAIALACYYKEKLLWKAKLKGEIVMGYEQRTKDSVEYIANKFAENPGHFAAMIL